MTGRTAYTPCAYEGCTRSPDDGHPLYRVNPKGEKGIFMCKEHASPKPAQGVVEICEQIAEG